MKFTNIENASPFDPNKYVAEELLEGRQSNVRIIKLAPGVTLPPHKHGDSDLMLFVVEGTAELDTQEGNLPFPAGALAFLTGDDELKVSNQSQGGVILLAFLTPAFPPRAMKS